MGLSLFGSSSSYDTPCNCKQHQVISNLAPLPNPNPRNYTILDSAEINKYLLVDIRYHDCTNYEGRKIMIFRDVSLSELKAQDKIDPHFSENKKYHSPIARFEPTTNGWNLAIDFCNLCID